MQSIFRKGAWIASVIAIVLWLNGCANIPEILKAKNSDCLWMKPITISENELKTLSNQTLREIDGYNAEWEIHCGNQYNAIPKQDA